MNLHEWLPRPSRAALRHAVRMTVAAVAALELTALLHLPDGYWAVITTMLIMQGSLGATLGAAVDRILATVAGAALGVIGAVLGARLPFLQPFLLVLVTVPLAILAMQRPSFRVAPVTAAIVLLIGGVEHDTLQLAFQRLLEISIGCVIGVVTAHFVMPGRARTIIQESTAATLRALGAAANAHLTRSGEAAIEAFNGTVRQQIIRIGTASTEEAREHAVHLAAGVSSVALLRTLRRLRSDVAILARVMAHEKAATDVMPEIGAVLQAQFDAAADFLERQDAAPSLAPLDAVITAAPENSILQFALLALRRDLAELNDRVAEYIGMASPGDATLQSIQ
jgi:uncharacterized membrane protein YccC